AQANGAMLRTDRWERALAWRRPMGGGARAIGTARRSGSAEPPARRRRGRLQLLGPEGGVAGLDLALADAEALGVRPRRRLHGVDREPLQLVPAEAEIGRAS